MVPSSAYLHGGLLLLLLLLRPSPSGLPGTFLGGLLLLLLRLSPRGSGGRAVGISRYLP